MSIRIPLSLLLWCIVKHSYLPFLVFGSNVEFFSRSLLHQMESFFFFNLCPKTTKSSQPIGDRRDGVLCMWLLFWQNSEKSFDLSSTYNGMHGFFILEVTWCQFRNIFILQSDHFITSLLFINFHQFFRKAFPFKCRFFIVLNTALSSPLRHSFKLYELRSLTINIFCKFF